MVKTPLGDPVGCRGARRLRDIAVRARPFRIQNLGSGVVQMRHCRTGNVERVTRTEAAPARRILQKAFAAALDGRR